MNVFRVTFYYTSRNITLVHALHNNNYAIASQVV